MIVKNAGHRRFAAAVITRLEEKLCRDWHHRGS
jgi:hypothetical protein